MQTRAMLQLCKILIWWILFYVILLFTKFAQVCSIKYVIYYLIYCPFSYHSGGNLNLFSVFILHSRILYWILNILSKHEFLLYKLPKWQSLCFFIYIFILLYFLIYTSYVLFLQWKLYIIFRTLLLMTLIGWIIW
jgi:hypothetical protein